MGADGPLLGRSIPNVDGVALVTGQARYTGDLRPARLAHGRIVRSPYAHALIRSVDPSAALALEGVLDVIVPDDVAGLPLVSTGPIADMPLLARGKVRYAGEPVAAVIASSEEIAERALDLVEIDYRELPVLLDPEAALAPDAPALHEGLEGVGGNACWRQVTKVGDVDGAFRSADVVLRERFRTSKAHAMPMETHAAVAEWDPLDGPTLWTSTQQPHVVRNVVAHVFGLPQSKVRVRKPFVGGAFGHKEGLHTHEAMALLGARRLRRPVRFVLTRTEEFSATVSRNPQIRDVEVALRRDGTVLGWRERIVQDVGAYSGLGPSVLALSEWVTVGPYRTPALDIEGVCVYTTKPPASAFRGFGNPQATFAREAMLDIAARALGMDPFELRRRNVIRRADLPTRTANGLKLVTLPIEEAMTVAAAEIDLEGLRARLGPFQGVGVANMIEWGGGCRWLEDWDADVGSVTITLHPDGSAVVASDAADSGQGHATLFTQIAADVLGVEPAKVSVVRGDTELSPFGLGTFGSRTSVVQASALQRACVELRERLLRVAANALEADAEDLEVEPGRIRVRGTGRGIELARLAAMVHEDRRSLPDGMEAGALVATASYDTPSEVPDANGYGNFAANYTCSATIAVVEVDPATGKIRILDWSSAEDAGRTLHPDLLKGQIQGGIAQGIGYALGEELLFDPSGTMLNPSMVDYQVPTAPEVPLIEDKLRTLHSDDPTHPLRNKGIGESGVTPAAAAIANAVHDAIGVPITTLPLTPEKVLEAIDRSRRLPGQAL
ncbi:MAG TPA: xanthine dehydrogenase family protein molybdopterin-binding subunit [Actinomycetes bacterium]|jgi:carbon-monoxide dehydrogenase large subunit|nr:xanthine dehydrogenase family protein molybdopterin-binding subunit [Actinomycetes bacterium]